MSEETAEILEWSSMDAADVSQIAAVRVVAFEVKEEDAVSNYAERLHSIRSGHTGSPETSTRCAVVRIDGKIIATADSFLRRIATPAGPLRVLALAGVACLPQHRGNGYGRRVARTMLQRVDQRAFDLSLFQTGVAPFYEKLGCRLVSNRFVNSLADDPAANPWWNPQVMIYPAAAGWPDGTIDLLGPGY